MWSKNSSPPPLFCGQITHWAPLVNYWRGFGPPSPDRSTPLLPVLLQYRQFYRLCAGQNYHKIWAATGFRDESPPQAKFCDTFVVRKGKQLSKLNYLNDQNPRQAIFLTLRSNAEIAKLSTLKTLIY